jgi:hypothetical protein
VNAREKTHYSVHDDFEHSYVSRRVLITFNELGCSPLSIFHDQAVQSFAVDLYLSVKTCD